MSESSHCFQKGNRNSGRRLCIMVCPSFWEDYFMLIYTHCWELMNSVGSHGSLSLLFVMKVMVCHFVSDSHEVMTSLIVVLPLIVVVEISLQLHRSSCQMMEWDPCKQLGWLLWMTPSRLFVCGPHSAQCKWVMRTTRPFGFISMLLECKSSTCTVAICKASWLWCECQTWPETLSQVVCIGHKTKAWVVAFITYCYKHLMWKFSNSR